MSIYFETTIKGGLPIIAEAEYDKQYGHAIVIGMYWKTGTRGTAHGRHVPDSIYNHVANNAAEMRRLNREATDAYLDQMGA